MVWFSNLMFPAISTNMAVSFCPPRKSFPKLGSSANLALTALLLENWASFSTSREQTSSSLMKVFMTSASMVGLSEPAAASSQVPPQKWA